MGIVTDHHTTIDGVAYTTKTFAATDALDIAQRMLGLVPDDAATLLLGVEVDGLSSVLKDPRLKFDIARKLARQAKPDELSSFAKDLLQRTTAKPCAIGDAAVEGNVSEHFDTHFCGRLSHLFEVCIWVVRVGFGAP